MLSSCNSCRWSTPIEIPEKALEEAVAEVADEPPFEVVDQIRPDWWELFGDKQLSFLIKKAFANNPNLGSVRRNILAAAYEANRLRAALFPNINWGADISRQKFSETGIIPFNTAPTTAALTPIAAPGGQAGIPVYFTQYETEFILNYNFDIWGKNRSLWQAALSEVQAKVADEAFAKLQLGILVAKTYFQLQIDYKRLKVASEIIKNREDYLNNLVKRQQNNLADLISVNLAKTELANANQSLLQIKNNLAIQEYQLKALLAGDFEDQISEVNLLEEPLPKVPIPVKLPMHLISLRPEIMAQLWLIESAGHQIDAAKAGFYPDFNLIALYGFQTIHFAKLFLWPKSTFFNVDPAVSLPIFDGGKLLANLRGSEVNYDLAILKYNELVLQAVQEILEKIALLKNQSQRWEEFQKRTDLFEQNYRLVNLRSQYNLNSKLDILTSQEEALNAQNDELLILGNTLDATLSLIQALGGGYDQDCYEG